MDVFPIISAILHSVLDISHICMLYRCLTTFMKDIKTYHCWRLCRMTSSWNSILFFFFKQKTEKSLESISNLHMTCDLNDEYWHSWDTYSSEKKIKSAQKKKIWRGEIDSRTDSYNGIKIYILKAYTLQCLTLPFKSGPGCAFRITFRYT